MIECLLLQSKEVPEGNESPTTVLCQKSGFTSTMSRAMSGIFVQQLSLLSSHDMMPQ